MSVRLTLMNLGGRDLKLVASKVPCDMRIEGESDVM